MGQSRPLFVYFRALLITTTQIEKSIGGVLGIRTHGRRMVGGDLNMELCRPPITTEPISNLTFYSIGPRGRNFSFVSYKTNLNWCGCHTHKRFITLKRWRHCCCWSRIVKNRSSYGGHTRNTFKMIYLYFTLKMLNLKGNLSKLMAQRSLSRP